MGYEKPIWWQYVVTKPQLGITEPDKRLAVIKAHAEFPMLFPKEKSPVVTEEHPNHVPDTEHRGCKGRIERRLPRSPVIQTLHKAVKPTVMGGKQLASAQTNDARVRIVGSTYILGNPRLASVS